MEATRIERDESTVMFIRTPDEVELFGPAWARLEELVGTRGRKFYGAFYERENEYRVCVVMKEEDDPDALGLETGTLPGGSYLRVRLRGEPPALYEQIQPTFEAMLATTPADETRPSLEFYRRYDEIDLLLPVASE
jgi:hypothetical protein